jgi:hypothetical protein
MRPGVLITVQPKATTCPTDAKLLHRERERLVRLAQKQGSLRAAARAPTAPPRRRIWVRFRSCLTESVRSQNRRVQSRCRKSRLSGVAI